jgi:hypothetical protein
MTDEKELVIDDTNFAQYFHDVRTNQPQRGQVMARYTAVADFVDGPLKRDLLELLLHHNAMSAPKIMKKMGCAVDGDSYRIPLEMGRDLQAGMAVDLVARKCYRYTVEVFFYTKKEYVPVDDPHWSVISLNNLESFLDAAENRVTITTRKVKDESSKNPPAGPEPGDGEGVGPVLEE